MAKVLLYLFDSNYIQNGHGVLQKALKLWTNCLQIPDARGLIRLWTSREDIDKYGGVKLRHSDPHFQQVFSTVFQRASYLAKAYSKGYSPPHVNEFGMSRLS